MNNYQKLIEKAIESFSDKAVDREIYEKFISHIRSTDKLTKNANIDEHICSFFVPYNRASHSVYLGHHIKANCWIPPGGHINYLEHPIDTVVREFEEELNQKITKIQVSPLSMTIKDISNNPRNPCKVHYDFWYLVDVPKIEFEYIKKEYYDAKWVTFGEAMKLMDIPLYKRVVLSIKDSA